MRRLLVAFLASAVIGLAQVPPAAPIYLTPSGPPGGGTFGTMSIQNANSVAITGGAIYGVTFGNNTLIGQLVLGGGPGTGGYLSFSPGAVGGLVVDVTQMWTPITLTDSDAGHPNETLTFTGSLGAFVQNFGALIYNSSATTAHHVTVPSSYSFNAGAISTTFYVQPVSYVYITWKWDGTNYYMSGDPRTISDLATDGSPLNTAWISEEPVATPGVVKKVAFVNMPLPHLVTFILNGNGSAIPSGTQVAYVLARVNFTITKWKMTCYPAGSTIEMDVFRIPNSSSGLNVLPTATIVGSGTKPKITTAVEAFGTPSDWVAGSGSVTITENDNLTVSVTAGATATYATLTISGNG